MRLLFLDAYFEPEQIAFTHLEKDLIKKLIQEGNEIQVICPTPTRVPSNEIIDIYKRKKKETIYEGRVHVRRFWAPQERKNPIIRAFRYFWCNLRTYQIGKKYRSIDIVFCNSTPPTQGWIAGRVAHKLNSPLVYSLQDIFPDSLITTGLSNNNSILWRIGRKLEDKTYKGCNKIIVITEAMKKNLLDKGVDKDKIVVITNWIDTETIKPVRREDNKLFDEFKLDRTKYIVLYAGNFGEAQGAEIILEVAERLQTEQDILFVIFGGGSGYDNAVRKARNLQNVFIHPLMPQDRISEVYSMGDVALITSKRGVGKSGMPSKTWSIMACNTPIIASFDIDSDLSKLLNISQTGKCIEPENLIQLIGAILDGKNKKQHHLSGREYAEKYASKETCLEQYAQLMKQSMTDYKSLEGYGFKDKRNE